MCGKRVTWTWYRVAASLGTDVVLTDSLTLRSAMN